MMHSQKSIKFCFIK